MNFKNLLLALLVGVSLALGIALYQQYALKDGIVIEENTYKDENGLTCRIFVYQDRGGYFCIRSDE